MLLRVLFPALIIPASIFVYEDRSSWSTPVLLFEDRGWTIFSALAASDDGTIHAFLQSDPSRLSEEDIGEPGADTLWYSQIRNGKAQEPVNVLVPPPGGGYQQAIRALTDSRGNIHLLLFSTAHCLQHSVVSLDLALSPIEWIKNSQCIADSGNRFGFVQGYDDQLHLTYITGDGRLEYSSYSPSTGRWSNPRLVHDADEDSAISDTRVAHDAQGRIHVVWSEYEAPNWYPPSGVFYSRSDDGGMNWTVPLELAGEGHVQPEILAVGDGQVHVIWNGSVRIGNRYHRFSQNGGQTWSPTHVFDIEGGILGPPAIAVDSLNNAHVILSSDYGLFYAFWSISDGWSEAEPIWEGAQAGEPSALVSGGNNLHILFRERSERIWYMSRLLEAPEAIPAGQPSNQTIRQDQQSPDPPPDLQTSSVQVRDQASQSPAQRLSEQTSSRSPISPMLFGAIAALFLVLGKLLSSRIQRQ